MVSTQFLSPRYESEVEVFRSVIRTIVLIFLILISDHHRRDSRKLPIGDPDVDWEETIYLNLVIHLFDYRVGEEEKQAGHPPLSQITLAICSRTSPTDLQVLRRCTQKVRGGSS